MSNLSTKQKSLSLHLKRSLSLSGIFDLEELRNEVRRIKEYSFKNIDRLTKKAVKNLRNAGWKVYLADSEEEALKFALEYLKDSERIVKSKSNAVKEIKLVTALEKAGKEVIETDLGDRIVQLLGEKSLHPLAPAIHISKERVAEAISDDLGYEVKPDVKEIVKSYSKWLLKYILESDASLTGANAIAAREGAVGLVENEGNISLITRLVKRHLVVAYTNKIVPTISDALKVIQATSVFGAGQPSGTYISFISGPSKTADVEGELVTGMHGAKEVAIILIKIPKISEQLKDAFYCLNCGICLSVCPSYYSSNYMVSQRGYGGIGAVRTCIYGESTEDIWRCTGCKACREVCPVKIDSGELIHHIRKKIAGMHAG